MCVQLTVKIAFTLSSSIHNSSIYPFTNIFFCQFIKLFILSVQGSIHRVIHFPSLFIRQYIKLSVHLFIHSSIFMQLSVLSSIFSYINHFIDLSFHQAIHSFVYSFIKLSIYQASHLSFFSFINIRSPIYPFINLLILSVKLSIH